MPYNQLIWSGEGKTFGTQNGADNRPKERKKKMKFVVRKLIRTKEGIYKEIPTNHRYLVVNVDEPYAPEVFRLIKEHEKLKGTWDGPDDFEEFIEWI